MQLTELTAGAIITIPRDTDFMRPGTPATQLTLTTPACWSRIAGLAWAHGRTPSGTNRTSLISPAYVTHVGGKTTRAEIVRPGCM